jgi:hypothetical protein
VSIDLRRIAPFVFALALGLGALFQLGCSGGAEPDRVAATPDGAPAGEPAAAVEEPTDPGGVEVGTLAAGAPCGAEIGGCADGLYCADRCIPNCSSEGGGACEGGAVCVDGLLDARQFCLQPCDDLFGQDCDAGFTCTILPDDPKRARVCLPDGNQPEGAACGFDHGEACGPGLVCEETCRKPCAAPGTNAAGSEVCGPGRLCSSANLDDAAYCITPCNPFESKCGSGQKCTLFSAEAATWTCGPSGTASAGAKCGTSSECAAGLLCGARFARDSAQCVRYCDPSSGAGCEAEELCVAQPLDEARMDRPGAALFGLCQR